MDCMVIDLPRNMDKYPADHHGEVNKSHSINHQRQDTLDHCMKAYNHGPCSRMSITFNSSKGLTNAPGQNNCFLNSAVQVLWHLDAFRRSFRLLSGHSCMGNACIFCALKVMFTQFQYSDKSVLPPDALRQAMAETFANQQRFQMGLMDDAAECFENMLMRIHSHIAPEESEDTCSVPYCLPHQKFSMSVSELVRCSSCGASSDPFTFNEMVFYVSTGALVNEHKAGLSLDNSVSFSNLLKNTVSKGDIRACPENCGQFGVKQRNLLNCPDVVSIGLVWESAKSGGQHIRDVVNCIGTTLNLEELFHSTPSDVGKQHTLQLVGVVCYYGKHYSTFFFHSKVQEWIYFDDAAVKQISQNWSKVCDKLCKGRHQPLLLLYMNPRTQAVDVSTAPKFSTMAPGHEWKNDDLAEDDVSIQNQRNLAPDSHSKGEYINPMRAHTPGPHSYYRQDELDGMSHQNVSRQSSNQTDRLDSGVFSGLSRQDSGVSSQSSRSAYADPETVSNMSALTKHSSDSSSSGIKECDGAMSYSSRASTVSSSTTMSSAMENEDMCYTMSNKTHIRRNNSNSEPHGKALDSNEPKRDKPKVSMKKKKAKNSASRLAADVVRYHSKSQADLLAAHECYDDSSLSRNGQETEDQKSFSYATLPRKKRVSSPNQTLQLKSPENNPNDTSWMKDVAMKGELLKQSGDNEVAATAPSVGSRIQMFNNIGNKPETQSTKPPEMKPLLQLNSATAQNGETTYINRSNVEKILYQQRKASRGPVTSKMVRPTYEEQFILPAEYTNERDKKVDIRYDMTDNTSVGSLKDSGYRSLGDRGSNSASSVSSVSAESPTMNHSFNFDTREPIYCEPPPISSELKDSADEDFDFPPPPSELELNSAHSKQLSEASLLSDASTLKQRKSPSLDSVDDPGVITQRTDSTHQDTKASRSRTNDFSHEPFRNLSLADSKLHSMIKSADDYITKSLDKESKGDTSTSLIFCQQATNLLSTVLSQRPENEEMEKQVQLRQESCLKRLGALRSKLQETEITKERGTVAQPNIIERRTMGELHIDNQTKRGAASSDYTPLHSAINRAPPTKPRELSRTDSQVSNSSTGSNRSQSVMSGVPQHAEKGDNLVDRSMPSNHSNTPSNYLYLPPKTRQIQTNNHKNGLYKEVNVPTTLQRHSYIREGCKPTERTISCASPSVIPPPKEFCEATPTRSNSNDPIPCQQYRNGPNTNRNGEQYSNYNVRESSAQQRQNNHHQPTVSRVNHNTYREVALPPKQNLNKQDIRDLLVQDMLKRQGQELSHPVAAQHKSQNNYTRPQSNSQSSSNNRLYDCNPQLRYSNYNNYTEAPLWTPPQQSAYDKGLSHYDSPSYHKKNIYGKVNTVSNANYSAYNSQHARNSTHTRSENHTFQHGAPSYAHKQTFNQPYSTEL